MAKINPIIKERISTISKLDLEKLVMKAASMNQQFHDYLMVNFIDKEYGEQDLFEAAKSDINFIFHKRFPGFSEELITANRLAACNKRIVLFSKVCKNKSLELDLK